MLRSVQQFFQRYVDPSEPAQGDNSARPRLAMAALLLEMTRADFEEQAVERDVVIGLLQQEFALTADQTRELVAWADQEVDAAACLHEFTSLLNRELSAAEKITVVEMLWQVAYADGDLDRYEEHLVRKVAELLYVPHQELVQAKHRVKDAKALR